MTPRRSFYRKVAYLVAMVPVLLGLHLLSAPATNRGEGAKGGPGGYLAQLRERHELSEAQLGEIDPTSETVKLATFGLRGVAANVLWEKAHRYKMKKDWTNLSATLQQISKLEPHFIPVWRFQAWNLSYNVSAEFDDYRKRYEWVIKGIDFLQGGIRYNEHDPRLLYDVGWFIAQKIGRADESKQFRQLFKADDDFHESAPLFAQDPTRDNWRVGKAWFARAEELVDQGDPLRSISPVIFYSEPPMCQMNYSETLEADGVFEERARRAWNLAFREWTDGPCERQPFGSREIPTADGHRIRLNDREQKDENARRLREQLEAISPGLRDKMIEERRARLSAEEREALELPSEERTEKQHQLAGQAERKLRVTYAEVAERLSGDQRSLCLELSKRLADEEEAANRVLRYRTIVNFEYWRRRAQVEQSSQALEARQLVFEGGEAFGEADLQKARQLYDAGLAKWREVLDMFPGLIDDGNFGDEWMEVIQKYRKVLDAQEAPFPENFVLQDVVDRYQEPEKNGDEGD
jgi:hypothetical protein